MRLQDKEHRHPPFDVAPGLGHMLVKLGVAEPFVNPKSLPKSANTRWGITEPRLAAGQTVGPGVSYSCGSCLQSGVIGGTYASFKFCHCGICEPVPEHIKTAFRPLAVKFYVTQEPAPRSLRDKAADYPAHALAR